MPDDDEDEDDEALGSDGFLGLTTFRGLELDLGKVDSGSGLASDVA